MAAANSISDARAINPAALYTVQEAAKLVSYHPVTLRGKLRAGTVSGRRRHGGHWRILGAELLKLGGSFFCPAPSGKR